MEGLDPSSFVSGYKTSILNTGDKGPGLGGREEAEKG